MRGEWIYTKSSPEDNRESQNETNESYTVQDLLKGQLEAAPMRLSFFRTICTKFLNQNSEHIH